MKSETKLKIVVTFEEEDIEGLSDILSRVGLDTDGLSNEGKSCYRELTEITNQYYETKQ